MFIQTQQPVPKCSQCGSTSTHYWDDEVRYLKGGGTKRDTWLQCNHCGHKIIDSTFTTSGNTHFSYQLPKPEPFKEF